MNINQIQNPKAVIFDMDGLLVDSEPMWEKAQIKIFDNIGIKVTVDMCSNVKGMKIDEAVKYWHNLFQWKEKSLKQIEDEIMDEMAFLMEKVEPLAGVIELINYYENKNIPMAIASSSYMRLINIVVDSLQIRNKIKIIHSGEYEKKGKPAPDIFLTTSKKLNINPENCIVFEDSVLGVKAGKSAGMKVVAVPYPNNFNNQKFDIADLKINSLKEILT
ncbi:MAG: hexitol phosphatase HxpB [Bacteroidota bacterium]|nr:hexitol phosphatase HxpB [Bacteroidota bacterium]